MIKVSIIIPVYNEKDELVKTYTALRNQTIPSSDFEIIIVDNGSTDDTKDLIKGFEGITYIIEDTYLNSPYSCRNRGIERSQGEIIVLLDATCIPEPDWLEKGVHCLKNLQADMISSNVLFDFRDKVTAGKLYDSNNLNIEHSIKQRGAVMTASLFIRREVFSKMGYFPEGVRSGADIRWTMNATKNGCTLKFCKKSIAKKKARTFTQSLKKQWRVAKGHPAIWKEQGKKINVFKKLISNLIPFHPKKVNRLAEGKGVEVNLYLKIKLYFVAYVIWVSMSVANIYGVYLMNRKKSDNA